MVSNKKVRSPFLSSVTEHKSVGGDKAAPPFCQVIQSEDFVMEDNPEEGFHFQRTMTPLEGLGPSTVKSTIVEEGVEGFNHKTLIRPTPSLEI